MINMIYSELLKLKKSYMAPVILIGGTAATIIMVIARLITENDMTFEKYAYNIEQLNNLMLYIVLFSIIAAYVFSREFADKTANVLYSYPVNRMKIFASKLIAIYILIFLTYLIEAVSIPVGYYFVHGAFPEGGLMIKDLKANSTAMFFQFLLVPIPVLIANISKNIIMPSVYGILSFILSNFLANNHAAEKFKYIPLTAPFFSGAYFYDIEHINLNYVATFAIVFFVIFMVLCIYEFNKKDIN